MNKKEKFSFLKGKGASVGIVLCFVAVIAMVGTVTFRNYKKNMNEQIAKVQQETEKLTKENDAAANSKDVLPMEGEEDATPSQTDHADRQEQEGASSTDGTEAENGQQQGQETDETAAPPGFLAMTAMLFAESMELPPPRPITKSQPCSRASAAPSWTWRSTGLGRILSNSACPMPCLSSMSMRRSR